MKTRQEIKAEAKAAMTEQRATSILLYVVYAVIVGGASGVAAAIPVLGMVLSPIVSLATMVLIVGLVGAFIKIYQRIQTEVGELFTCFNLFGRNLLGILWMTLFTVLWTWLFIIPGIVKSYAYFATPYILAESKDVEFREALKLSMRMTNGYKMKLFVTHLSFIGWYLLGMLTFGILLILYVAPYMQATMAGWYIEMRDAALANGTISREELQ